jgi:hypothetical protein
MRLISLIKQRTEERGKRKEERGKEDKEDKDYSPYIV